MLRFLRHVVVGAGCALFICGGVLVLLTVGVWVETEAHARDWPKGLATALLASITLGAIVGGLSATDNTDG